MKRIILQLMFIATVAFTGVILFSSCSKVGPKGPAGANGKDGTDGNSATCAQCHNLSDDLVAKIGQYDASQHAMGTTNMENSTNCAGCHTSQGFIECLSTGSDTTAATIDNPATVNCRTCHPIHSTYTTADYSLRVTTPITLRVNASPFDYGKANLCAKCHQARKISIPLDSTVFHLSAGQARYFGYHHSPVANLFAGVGGIEIPGLESYTTPNKHKNVPDACITCHMLTNVGYLAGGHTWRMSYLSNGNDVDNVAACAGCHPGLTSFDRDNVQTDVQTLLNLLKVKLVNVGIMDTSNYGKAGTWTYNQLGAFINYNMCREDKSLGVHNPTYIHALLQNSYDALP